ncbi:MAG: Amidohydrolase/deacetylase family metallohydrolase [Thermoproteota archaeon]|nr:Amidohydrolase/deacetylase family metallohydrolase [Thermoproteota archaeon]
MNALKYDLLITGGLLIDPSQGINDQRDIAVSGGKVAAIEKNISAEEAKEVFDALGKIVTPGLVDIHTHIYRLVSYLGADPDLNCLAKGVTTVVDAGSSGALNFPGFRKYIVEACQTRIFEFLHVSDVGLTMGGGIGELEDLRHLDFERTVKVARENRGVIVGIKIRVPQDIVGQHGPQCLRLAKEISRTTGLPLMVHPGALPPNLSLIDVLGVLEKGDIMTHIYPPPYPPLLPRSSIFNENGRLLPEIQKARDRGVLFDVGHGMNNFCWDTAEEALKQGFMPTTISSDLTAASVNSVVQDLPTILSKFLHVGISLYDVIKYSTIAPSQILGKENEIGTLKVGAEADITVFKLEEGEFPLWDNIRPVKEQRVVKQLLKPVKVVKGGSVIQSS